LLSHDKLDHITALLDIHHFDTFALSETWLSSYELEEISISIDGYNLPLIKNRSLGRVGGVALYLANYRAFNRRQDFEIPELVHGILFRSILETFFPYATSNQKYR
jgi:hypothetical protein